MNEYLQWVSTLHYKTIQSFCEEIAILGVSRRLANYRMAMTLALNPSVIYLVHNDGRFSHCFACSESKVCFKCNGLDGSCSVCKGLGLIEKASGGYAVVDGNRWDYVKYIVLKRKSRHEFWNEPHTIGDISVCKVCGGKGRIPMGQIFGFFVPDNIIYIAKGDETTEILDKFRKSNIAILSLNDLKSDRKRLSGYKIPGAFYATTNVASKISEKLAGYYEIVDDRILERIRETINGVSILSRTIPYCKKLHRTLKKINILEEL